MCHLRSDVTAELRIIVTPGVVASASGARGFAETDRNRRFRALAWILIVWPSSRRNGPAHRSRHILQEHMKTIIVMTSLAILHPSMDAVALDASSHQAIAETASAQPSEELREPWRPSADVAEDEREYSIILELPGFSRGDFDVSVENGWIYVSGERQMPDEKDGRLFNRIERKLGEFERKFRLPEDADAASISARYSDGLLTVKVAKDPNAGRKRIEIQFK